MNSLLGSLQTTFRSVCKCPSISGCTIRNALLLRSVSARPVCAGRRKFREGMIARWKTGSRWETSCRNLTTDKGTTWRTTDQWKKDARSRKGESEGESDKTAQTASWAVGTVQSGWRCRAINVSLPPFGA